MKKTFKKSLSILMSVVLICSMAFSLQITPVIAEDAGTTDEVSFYENLSEAEFAEDDTITVLIEFDYPENDYDIRETDSLESSQEQLRLLRASNRAYYTENNQEFIDDLDIEYDDMDVSAYSPYVFVTFETWDEYADARDDLIDLSENSKVKKVFAEETPVMGDAAVNVNTSLTSTNVSIDEAKKMIGVKDENGFNVSNYSGEGIRVGIIESGSPDNLTNFANGEIKAIRDSVGTTKHATKVLSIIGGTYGIAPDVEFYVAGSDPFGTAVEWLIDQQVNIINVSWGSNREGDYLFFDAYTDYISRSNLVLFIVAAGNYNPRINPQRVIVNPGLGLNVLTVGSVDANQNISYFSNYVVADSFSKKPTFVAPGENIIVPNCENDPNQGYNSGTSFSAPMVSGIAALLIEEFPSLLNYPDLLASALINGCEWIPGQSEMWDDHAGAGLVNYINTREILSEQRYDTDITTQSEDDSTVLLEATAFLATNEELTYCFFSFARQSLTEYNFNEFGESDLVQPITPDITQYQVRIFDSSGNIIHSSVFVNNIIVGRLINLSGGKLYYIRVYMVSDKETVSSEYLSLTYSTTHEHSYTSYTNLNKRMHTCHCACGESITELHVFQEIFGEARTCVKCGYTE